MVLLSSHSYGQEQLKATIFQVLSARMVPLPGSGRLWNLIVQRHKERFSVFGKEKTTFVLGLCNLVKFLEFKLLYKVALINQCNS